MKLLLTLILLVSQLTMAQNAGDWIGELDLRTQHLELENKKAELVESIALSALKIEVAEEVLDKDNVTYFELSQQDHQNISVVTISTSGAIGQYRYIIQQFRSNKVLKVGSLILQTFAAVTGGVILLESGKSLYEYLNEDKKKLFEEYGTYKNQELEQVIKRQLSESETLVNELEAVEKELLESSEVVEALDEMKFSN